MAEFVTHLLAAAMRFKGDLREPPDQVYSAKSGHVESMSAHTGKCTPSEGFVISIFKISCTFKPVLIKA